MANEEVLINTPEGIQNYMAGRYRNPGVYVIRNSSGGLAMAVRSQGVERGGKDAGEDKAIAVDNLGSQYAVASAAPYAELTRLGGGWSAIATSAVVGLVVRPSTTAQFTLFNGNSAGGESYVIDRLFTHNLVSTSALSLYSIWACVHPAGMTDPGEDITASASNVTGNSGKTYNGNAVVGVAETVIDNGWYPWATSVEVTQATTLPGSHLVAEVAGRLIVPPQGGISLTVVASLTSTVTFTSGLSWYEIQLDLK